MQTEGFSNSHFFNLTFAMAYDTIKWINSVNGAWRSPEARLNGVQEVAGSNPVAPISDTQFSLSALRSQAARQVAKKGGNCSSGQIVY